MEWKNAKTFIEAQELMIKFLKGKIKETPWHIGEVDEETVDIIQKLIEINRKGFMTVEGQPGTCLEKTDINTGEKYDEIQRAYIVGFIENSKVKKLLRRLKDTDNFFYYSERLNGIEYNYDEKYILEANGKHFIPLTVEKGKSFHNNYTKFFIPKSPGDEMLDMVGENIELYNDMKENSTYLFIIRKKTCETDLEDIINRLLENLS